MYAEPSHSSRPQVLGFFLLVPVAMVFEGLAVRGVWTRAVKAGGNPRQLSIDLLSSGLFHYLNNEVTTSLHP
jgi:hypothetical protein